MDVAALQTENQQLREDLSEGRQRIAQLEELVRALRQRHFGASSERSPDQITLFDDDPEAETAAEPEPATPVRSHTRRSRGPRINADLPRVDVIHDLDPADRFCGEHGCELTPMGEETSEQVEFIPAKVQSWSTCANEGHLRPCEHPQDRINRTCSVRHEACQGTYAPLACLVRHGPTGL